MRYGISIGTIFLLGWIVFLSAPAYANEASLRTQLRALETTTPGSAAEEATLSSIGNLMRGLVNERVPETFFRHMARGEAFVEAAQSSAGMQRAANEFEAAIDQAPWRAEAYYNWGIVLEKAGQFDAAMRALKVYLAAAPNADDARQVRNRIYGIEAHKEAVAGQTQQKRQAKQMAEEQKRQAALQQERQLYDSIVGTWRFCTGSAMFKFERAGDDLRYRIYQGGQWGGGGVATRLSGGNSFRADEGLAIREFTLASPTRLVENFMPKSTEFMKPYTCSMSKK